MLLCKNVHDVTPPSTKLHARAYELQSGRIQ